MLTGADLSLLPVNESRRRIMDAIDPAEDLRRVVEIRRGSVDVCFSLFLLSLLPSSSSPPGSEVEALAMSSADMGLTTGSPSFPASSSLEYESSSRQDILFCLGSGSLLSSDPFMAKTSSSTPGKSVAR